MMLLAALTLPCVRAAALRYTLLPGQSFESLPADTVWHISTWQGQCVVKVAWPDDADSTWYALVSKYIRFR